MEQRKPSPTDLSDTQWAILAPLVPVAKPGGRPETYAKRAIVNAILSVVRSGGAWRMLPHDLPPRGIVYPYFRQWRRDGTWPHRHDALRGDVRVLEGRHRQPSAGSMDAQSVKTTERGGVKGVEGGTGVKGRQRPIWVEVLGLLLAVLVTGAEGQDRDGARSLLCVLRHRFPWLRCIWADGAYTGWLETWVTWRRSYRRVRLEIVKRSDHAKGLVLLPTRWGVERTFGWFGKYRRLSTDYEYLPATSEAMISVVMIHIMLRRIEAKTLF